MPPLPPRNPWVCRFIFRALSVFSPRCGLPPPSCKLLPGPSFSFGSSIRSGPSAVAAAAARLVTDTLFGTRRGRVSLSVQENPRCLPSIIVELALQTQAPPRPSLPSRYRQAPPDPLLPFRHQKPRPPPAPSSLPSIGNPGPPSSGKPTPPLHPGNPWVCRFIFRFVCRALPVFSPRCGLPPPSCKLLPGPSFSCGSSICSSPSAVAATRLVIGTLFGPRQGRVSLSVQENPQCLPSIASSSPSRPSPPSPRKTQALLLPSHSTHPATGPPTPPPRPPLPIAPCPRPHPFRPLKQGERRRGRGLGGGGDEVRGEDEDGWGENDARRPATGLRERMKMDGERIACKNV